VPVLQDIPIKLKLTAIIMIASTVALLLVSGGFVAYELAIFRQTMKRDLLTLGQIVGNQSTAAVAFQDKDTAEEIMHGLKYKNHIVAAALYDPSGNLFSVYFRTNSAALQAAGKIPARPESNTNVWDVERFESDRLIVFHTFKTASDDQVAGTIFLESDLDELHQRESRYAGIIMLFMVASSLVTLFLSSLLQRVITRPIFALAETARAVTAEKNYSVRVAKYGRDELGQLVDAFNDMLGGIQDRDSKLQNAKDELEARVLERTRSLRDEINERRRAEAALQQQFVRISLLNQITQAISDRQDTDSILHVVLHQLDEHLGIDLGTVALFDAGPQTLNVAALCVKNSLLAKNFDWHKGSVVPLSDTDFQHCAEGQTVYISDTLKWKSPFVERLAAIGWRSVVAVPLMVEEKLFGILIAARLKPEGFSSGDAEFLRMLSEHVALAAHQARLHTDLEKAYNELRRTQATVLQQERLKALGQMASGIAHDVNNALSPVIGFADLILKGDYGLKADAKRYLGHIRTAGEDIAHIVARLREFYRTREVNESLQQLSLNTLVEQVVDMTRPRWRDIPQSNGITIEVQTALASDLPRLAGIESEIREAITNLVLNAVDAMPSGGRITISTRVIRDNGTDKKGKQQPLKTAIEITDSGTGMDEETRKRCLEPFFSTKGKRGTGLGLAMVYGVMERHAGGIEIQSELGKGTTFRLIFPVRTSTPTSEPEKDGGVKVEPMQILCIDDESLLRELLKEILERDGHEVVLSDNGQSGLDEFRIASERNRPFDLVITDLGMPYLDGRQVAKTIKLESPRTPVLMLTGWGAFMKEDGSGPTEVDGILSKPPRSREIRDMLRKFGQGKHKNGN
jgi:signal transduction histidine kinase/ActR/RegA family two-component response regulator/HAMP domain-containing protein